MSNMSLPIPQARRLAGLIGTLNSNDLYAAVQASSDEDLGKLKAALAQLSNLAANTLYCRRLAAASHGQESEVHHA